LAWGSGVGHDPDMPGSLARLEVEVDAGEREVAICVWGEVKRLPAETSLDLSRTVHAIDEDEEDISLMRRRGHDPDVERDRRRCDWQRDDPGEGEDSWSPEIGETRDRCAQPAPATVSAPENSEGGYEAGRRARHHALGLSPTTRCSTPARA